jgi:ferredoxin-NADP reductase
MALTLVNKEHLVDNIWAFRFEPNEPFTWTAGQYMRVELPHDNPDDEGTKRWFTVSSAPYQGIAQITTRVTESTFKQALAALPIGGELQLLEKPHGDFVWQDSDPPIVFVAGGIGITPFYSILKQRAHDGLPLHVTLIYGGRTPDVPFKNEFDQWVSDDPLFKVHYVVGAPLTAESIAVLEPGINNSLVYVSGPEPMVEALGAQLKEHGLPEEQLKQDFFPNYTEKNY